jgi:CheY-like chemotaxis protein
MNRTVLVVDDDPLILDWTAGLLGDLGCDVVTAPNAIEALVKLKTDKRIDVLITDINMPGMSGFQLVEKAQQRHEGLQVILLSGLEADGRGFPMIRKPFLKADLVRTMEQATRPS